MSTSTKHHYFDWNTNSHGDYHHKMMETNLEDKSEHQEQLLDHHKYKENNDYNKLREHVRSIWYDIKQGEIHSMHDYQSKQHNTGHSTNGGTIMVTSSIIQALLSIHILNDDDSSASWIHEQYGGRLHDLPIDFIQSLKQSAPSQFNARVADFNHNLFYDIQQQYGLNHLNNKVNHDNYDNNQHDVNLDHILQNTIQSNQYLGSFLATETTTPQPPHVDYTWERLAHYGNQLRLGFFPLTQDGMFLQVWKRNDDLTQQDIHGDIVFIPYGKLLILPADTIHGGGFRTTPHQEKQQHDQHGNLRFHLYIAQNADDETGILCKNQTTNKYTEPGDKTKELSNRYINAPMMNEMMKYLFVSEST